MNLDKIEYAIYYATKAHKGQRRKMEDVDMIFHPFTVGMILQRNGQDEDVVAAGILHDVVEDTEKTFDDIEKCGYHLIRKEEEKPETSYINTNSLSEINA